MVDANPVSPPGIAPGLPQGSKIGVGGEFETWQQVHLDSVAWAVDLSLALAIRVLIASRSYLNPDEALHYLLLNQSSIFLAYKASLTNAHPPLIYLLLYYWRFLGAIRVYASFALGDCRGGNLLAWIQVDWDRLWQGGRRGGAHLPYVFSAMIALSAEVRSYALLLCFLVASLYFLESALREQSVGKMWCFFLLPLPCDSFPLFRAVRGACDRYLCTRAYR